MSLFGLTHIFQDSEPTQTDEMPGANPVQDRTTHQLQSREHAELLDAIDRLRRESINAGLELSIPEVVVCGDQSSGKSSVLEAVAGIPFPLGVGTVTCFVTEVILRNTAEESILVRLFPEYDSWEDYEQRQRIRDWQPGCPILDVSDVPAVVTEAANFLKSMDTTRKFWRDRLQIELSGPSQPHLTLVDLPGLIQNDSEAMNKDMILSLTKERLASERAVILAVVDAPTDLERHQIIQLLKDTNSQQRTMGILTKPDTLNEASDQEKLRIRMVQNGLSELGLGWHVLRNLPHERPVRSATVRDVEEAQFFQKRAWAQVDEGFLGVEQLRSKLSHELLIRIQQDLPKLIEEMERLRSRNVERLKRLGDARDTGDDKKNYLRQTLLHLRTKVRDELSGSNTLLSDSGSEELGQEQVLREAINTECDNFASAMLDVGQTFHIGDERESTTRHPPLPKKAPIPFRGNLRSGSTANYTVDLHRYCNELVQHMSKTRGTGLRGMPSTAVTKDIFRQQSQPWESIVLQHTENCQAAVRGFFTRVCKQAVDGYTADRLLSYLVYPRLLEKFGATDEKVQELLWPYTRSHPMIIDARFNISKRSNPWEESADKKAIRRQESTKSWVERVEEHVWVESKHRAAASEMDIADTYYEVAMRTLVENMATLAIERCLLSSLPDIVSPLIVEQLSVEDIAAIATERPTDRENRARYQAQLTVLDQALQTCRMHNTTRPQARLPTRAQTGAHVVRTPPANKASNSSVTPKSVLAAAQTKIFQPTGPHTEPASFNPFGTRISFDGPSTSTNLQQTPSTSSATSQPAFAKYATSSTPNLFASVGQGKSSSISPFNPSVSSNGQIGAGFMFGKPVDQGLKDASPSAGDDKGKDDFIPFALSDTDMYGRPCIANGQSVCFANSNESQEEMRVAHYSTPNKASRQR